MGDFDEIKQMAASYKKKVEEEGRALLSSHFKKLFDEHPKVAAIRWRQYTPHFNDGDACEFGVREFEAKLRQEGAPTKCDPDEDDDAWVGDYSSKCPVPKLSAFRQAIPEDVMEIVFGDHVRVTATRDGFDVEEYEHD